MADVIAKMKVDTKEYDAGLSKATKRLNDFTKQNTSLNGIMAQGISTLTKFAGGFAAVELAAKGFNAIIMDGSQVTGDFVRNGLGAVNDTLGVLATSIATMDFTPLLRGLDDVYSQALAARESLDSLGDTLRGLGIAGSDAREAVAELRAVNADSTSTDEQKAKALEDANTAVKDYKEVVQATITETNNWVDSSVKAMSGMRGVKTSAEDVKKAVIDYAKYDSEGKKQIVDNATEINRQYGKLVKAREKLNPKYFTTVDISGATHTHQTSAGGTAAEIEAADAAIRKFEQDNAAALRQYVLFNAMSNEEADAMAQNVSNLSEYGRGLARMEKQLSDAQRTMASTTKVTGGGRTKTTTAAEPITSNLNIEDIQPSLEKALPSMNTLTKLAKEFKDDMLSATTKDQFDAAAAALERAERAIELQPIAIQAGISLDEAVAEQHLQSQLDEMQLSMQVMVELNKESMAEATASVKSNAKDSEKSWNKAASAISSAGNALQNIDSVGFNVAGSIMQAIADVALSFAMALKDTKGGPWAWIAAAAAGAATMTAVIATIRQATAGSYAQGGIIPGKYNGGLDNTYVYASPGEVILNRAQQENLLSQLEPATSSGTSYVSGEQLITVINNTGRRRGKGEIIFG